MIQLIYFSLNVEAEIQILLVSNLLICIWIGMLLNISQLDIEFQNSIQSTIY